MAVQGQWRIVIWPRGISWEGLDYGACEAGFRLSGVEVPPELWEQVRLIEDGAKSELNGH